MTMKYIVTEDEVGNEDMIIFSERIHHDAMMEVLEGVKNQTHVKGDIHYV